MSPARLPASGLLAAFLLLAPQSRGDSTLDPAEKYAWSGNTGWIDCALDQPLTPTGIVFGGSYLSGFAYSANLGYLNFGDGSPNNGHTYLNHLGTDFGVNHDGAGNLSGLAWSSNTGWINFGWAEADDPNRPRVDLLSGEFSGFAWGANTGWIALAGLTTNTMECPDSDRDGIADHWEWAHFSSLATAHATSDRDGDGVSDRHEYEGATDPNDPDHYFRLLSEAIRFGANDTSTTLEFTSSPTRHYFIQYTTSDQSLRWINSSLGTFAPSSGATTSKNLTAPAASRTFFRVGALRPLSGQLPR